MKDFSKIPTWGMHDILTSSFKKVEIIRHETNGENSFSQPHKHNFYLLFLVKSGHGKHHIDFESFDVQPQQLHFLLPEQVHDWQLDNKTKGYQLMFSEETIQLIPNLFHISTLFSLNHPIVNLDNIHFKKIEQEFELLFQEFSAQKIDYSIIEIRTILILKQFLNLYENQFPDFIKLKSNSLLIKFEKLLNENFSTQKNVSFYAQKLNITSNYLNILTKDVYNLQASEIIKSRIVLEAKRLITTTSLSIKQIGQELGFDDLGNFSNFFKNRTGITPKDFYNSL